MLTELTLVPSIVGVVTGLRSWIKRPPARRLLVEAALLGVGFFATAGLDVSPAPSILPALNAVWNNTPLAVQLPFRWAAWRFVFDPRRARPVDDDGAHDVVGGPGPGSLCRDSSATTSVSAITLSLTVVGVALLSVAALIEDRRQTQLNLAAKLRVEEPPSKLSGAFVQVPSYYMAGALGAALAHIGAFMAVDCAIVFRESDAGRPSAIHVWADRRLVSLLLLDLERDFPWALARLRQEESTIVNRTEDIPAEAVTDRASMATFGLNAAMSVALRTRDRNVGVLGVGQAVEREWSGEEVQQQRLLADVLLNALARQQTEDALRDGEIMKSAILQSLTSGVVVVDHDGDVLSVNDSWRRLSGTSGAAAVERGDNLIAICRESARLGEPRAGLIAGGVGSILDGSRDRFVIEHMSRLAPPPASGRCWRSR